MMRANAVSDSWVTVPAIRNLDIFAPADSSERGMSLSSSHVDSPDQFTLIAESLKSQQRRTVSEAAGNHFIKPLFTTIYGEDDMNQGAALAPGSSGPASGPAPSQGRDTTSSSMSGVRRALEVQDRKFDAQDVYPTRACLFVGNLLFAATDKQLEIALQKVFAEWGTPFIKIKRPSGPDKNPYAFAQFCNVKESEKAAVNANGIPVFGRPIRIERSNSKLFWFVYREDGAFITVDEVEMAIRGLGSASVEVAPSTLSRKFDRGYGIKVQFEQWDESRDLSRTFQRPWVAKHYDEAALDRQAQRLHGRGNGGGMPNGTMTTHQMHQAYRSVYCGNLPRDVAEGEIRSLFNPVTNHVLSIRIVRKERGSYAFVELPNREMCNQASSALNGLRLRGLNVKVEPRRSVGGQLRANVSSQNMAPGNQNQQAASVSDPPHRRRPNGAISGTAQPTQVQPAPHQPEPVNKPPVIEPQPDHVASAQDDINGQINAQVRQLVALRQGSGTSTYSTQFSLDNHGYGALQQLMQAPQRPLFISGPPAHEGNVNASLTHLAASAAQGAAAASMLPGFPNVGVPIGLAPQAQPHVPWQFAYLTTATGRTVLVRVPLTFGEAKPTQ